MKLLSLALILAWQGICYAESLPAGSCSLVPDSKTCIDSTPCKTDTSGNTVCLAGASPPSGALRLQQTCWQYSYSYACSDQVQNNSCSAYENNSACSIVSTTCVDKIAETGKCDVWQLDYQCKTKEQQTTTQIACSSGLFDESKYPTPENKNSTFAKAAVAQEMMREAQVYNDGHIFSGVAETCTKGYYGIRNCCDSSPQAQSNSAVMSTAIGMAGSVVKYAGAKAVDMASSYMYDAMYQNSWTNGLASYMSGGASTAGTNLASNGLSVGAWGFTYSTGTFTAGSGLMGANTQIMSFGSNGYLTFNPYVFAAMVAIYVYQTLSACTQEEITLSMHRGANLSYYVETTCAKKALGSCVEWENKYCSFNSVLAKIINYQGKQQLGLSLTDCKGLTVDQLNSIDFTKIDFSEFTKTIMEKATENVPTNINENYTPIMKSTSQGSSQSTNSSVIPSY